MSDVPAAEAVEPKPLLLEPLDIQHDTDPAEDHSPARRIPHLGHAILFFSIAIFFINLSTIIFFTARHLRTDATDLHPLTSLAAEAVAYAFTLLAAVWLFPRLWRRSFLEGIEWNMLAVQRRWYVILAGGVVLSVMMQVLVSVVPHPEKVLLDDMLRTGRDAWCTAAFAVLIAPLVEEIAFRGFLLPALATAYDWLALERTPAGIARWKNSTFHSAPALVFAAIFSSVPFALIHAPQLSHAWGIVGVLCCVSLVLSFVRIRTHSLAASALMHATYNFTVFFTLLLYTGGFRHLDKLAKAH